MAALGPRRDAGPLNPLGATSPRLAELIEVGAGLGAFKGKAWRIGLMGESATARHVAAVLSGLGRILPGVGLPASAVGKTG